mmetsp:Transcript_21421/g.48358  ORF Transcript_21421/g.48358 Transcript_21421/m.48358 type:complete len:1362 (-) Transcript_21421:42-4127(-)
MLALALLLTLSLIALDSASGFSPQATFAHSNNLSFPTGPRTLLNMKTSKAIPKEETGIYELFEQYPKADGRGVKIAILDTGCDLAARGLNSTTSDGVTPKYIDFIDCTGDGDINFGNKTVDIDFSTTKTLEGLSGRNLTLGAWAEGVDQVKLGAIRLFELLPGNVERRIKRERKDAFLTKHTALLSSTQATLDGLPTNESDKDKKKAIDDEKKELELLIDQLNSIAESYEDYGPLMDVVMFQQGGTWKAVIDLDANGDLTSATPMAPFAVNRDVGELRFGSAVTFCVQVYDEGKTLSIVTDAGSHGTHVAGITGCYFPSEEEDEDDLNGVAPGAQILACKIGDGRLGSAETGTGLIRALIAAKKHGCDLVNLSYGEPSWQPDSGRVSDIFAKAVNDWGMLVFTSAGNDGPALSSLGSPGSESAPVTVGAWASPKMMTEQYSTLPPAEGEEALQSASYYFSSRGPTPDGALPDVCAPGGAIAPIPRHSLQGKAQYHGTSMSSPNACGVAACILSAVRDSGLNIGPHELKRALKNTAKTTGIFDPFAQGAGLVSALDCVEYILAHNGKPGQSLAVAATIPGRDNARGLYLRDEIELEAPMSFSITVKPQFSHANIRTSEEMEDILSLELDLKLESSASWVTCPESLRLLSAQERNGQAFAIRLNTTSLKPGVHYATVSGHDDGSRGSLFSLPITVVVPHSRFVDKEHRVYKIGVKEEISLADNGVDYTTTFNLVPGVPNRRFITVPQGAEFATIKVKPGQYSDSAVAPRVYLHAVPFVRGDMHNVMNQLKKVYQVRDGVEHEFDVRVKGGSTLELCQQLLWLANPSPALVTATVEFHSYGARSQTLISSQPVVIGASSGFARLGADAFLRSEVLNPTANLKSVQRTLRPKDVAITLGSNDLDKIPVSDAERRASKEETAQQIYEMRTTYEFKVEGDKDIAVRPCVTSLFYQIYDSPVDSQLWVMEDSSGQVLSYGSCMHHADSVKLKKGTYTVKLLLRHPSRSTLEKLKHTPIEINMDLNEKLACQVNSRLAAASTPDLKADALGKKVLTKGAHQDVYVSRPATDLPAFVSPGDVLVGAISLDKDKEGVTSMKIIYPVPPKPSKDEKKDDKKADTEEEKTLEDVVFEAKLAHLAKIRSKNSSLYADISNEMKEERPTNIKLLTELLSSALESPKPETEKDDETSWRARAVGAVYADGKKAIDTASLAQYFGTNAPDKDELDEDKDAKDRDKEMKEQRDFLRKVLLSHAFLAGILADEDSSFSDQFAEAVKELKTWVKADVVKDDKDKVKLTLVNARHARICKGKVASAIAALIKAKKEFNGKELKQINEELIKVYGLGEGMEHLVLNGKDTMYAQYPSFKRSI